MSARERILSRVRDATSTREPVQHPGAFSGARTVADTGPVETFIDRLFEAGGEAVHFPSHTAASAWARDFANHHESVSISRLARFPMAFGAGEGPAWIETVEPEEAELGVSLAVGAVAETGSLILSALEGRRVQLLPPVHLVLVDESRIFATLREALVELKGVEGDGLDEELGVDLDAAVPEGLPSALGLHSGPSKSADIGQILVKGVHGPGRLVVVIVGSER